MKRVCHMTSAHSPEDTRIFCRECTSLAKNGYETYIVERGDTYTKNGVHMIGIGEVSKSRLKRMIQVARKVYKVSLEINADIYHIHDPELLPYGLKLKRRGKRVIFDSHENYYQQISIKPYLPKVARNIIALLWLAYETYATKKIDAVIVPCKGNGKGAFEGRTKKLVYVNNVPNMDEFEATLLPIYEERRGACYTGGLTKERGITQIATAMKKVNSSLILAGKFSSDDYMKEILSISDNIVYKGLINHSEIYELYKRCAIGIALLRGVGQYSRSNNLPTKVYEYMAMEMPVVLSDFPYNRKINDKYHIGLLANPDNINEITSAICYLMEHTEEAKQMGRNGRRAIEKEFNWNFEEKKLLALYEELIISARNID